MSGKRTSVVTVSVLIVLTTGFIFWFSLRNSWTVASLKARLQADQVDRVLFGTDTPWHTAPMELRLLGSLGLTEAEMAAITHENAEKLIGQE